MVVKYYLHHTMPIKLMHPSTVLCKKRHIYGENFWTLGTYYLIELHLEPI